MCFCYGCGGGGGGGGGGGSVMYAVYIIFNCNIDN